MKAILFVSEMHTMHPLTLHIPGVLIPVMGRELLSYPLTSLKDSIEEWIIVAPEEEKDRIEHYLERAFPTYSITIETIETFTIASGEYLCLQANTLYAPEDIQRLLDAPGNTLLLSQEKVECATKVFKTKAGNWSSVSEDKEQIGLYAIGAYKATLQAGHLLLDSSYLPSDVHFSNSIVAEGYVFSPVYPWNILEIQEYFLKKADLAYFVHSDAKVHVTAYIGNNVVVGPGAIVGEEVELENTCLFPGVRIGSFSRIHGSVLGENTFVEPDTIVDASASSTVEVLTDDKQQKKVRPTYTGIFTGQDARIKGFYTESGIIL